MVAPKTPDRATKVRSLSSSGPIAPRAYGSGSASDLSVTSVAVAKMDSPYKRERFDAGVSLHPPGTGSVGN